MLSVRRLSFFVVEAPLTSLDDLKPLLQKVVPALTEALAEFTVEPASVNRLQSDSRLISQMTIQIDNQKFLLSLVLEKAP